MASRRGRTIRQASKAQEDVEKSNRNFSLPVNELKKQDVKSRKRRMLVSMHEIAQNHCRVLGKNSPESGLVDLLFIR
jgi:hypothetical protein